MIYEGDINLCNETPNRGGLNLIKLKKKAINDFGIDVKGKFKEDICNEIKDKLNENVKNKKGLKEYIKLKNSGKKQNIKKYSKKSNLRVKYSFNDVLKGDDDDDDDQDEDENEDEDDKFSDIIYSKSKDSSDEDDEQIVKNDKNDKKEKIDKQTKIDLYLKLYYY